MTHNELINKMVDVITFERAVTCTRLAGNAPAKNQFILSSLTGNQLELVKRYIASFKLNT